MRKYHTVLHEPTRPARRSRLPRIFAFVLVLLVSPLLYEGALILAARWQSMMGSYWEPRTPIIDAFMDWSQTANLEVSHYCGRLFNSGPWNASLAVPIAIAWSVGIALLFLRRTH